MVTQIDKTICSRLMKTLTGMARGYRILGLIMEFMWCQNQRFDSFITEGIKRTCK